MSFVAHLTPPFARLARSPRGLLALLAWPVVALATAFHARAAGGLAAADRVMLGMVGPIVLPLLSFGIVAAVLGGDSTARAARPLVAFGASPVRAVLGATFVAMLASALLAASLAAGAAALAHGAGSPELAYDILASGGAGAAAGLAYAAFFALGASFGPKGAVRIGFLFANWLLGEGTGVFSVVVPYAHVRNILGGAAPLALSARGSYVALGGITVLSLLWLSRRSRYVG